MEYGWDRDDFAKLLTAFIIYEWEAYESYFNRRIKANTAGNAATAAPGSVDKDDDKDGGDEKLIDRLIAQLNNIVSQT